MLFHGGKVFRHHHFLPFEVLVDVLYVKLINPLGDLVGLGGHELQSVVPLQVGLLGPLDKSPSDFGLDHAQLLQLSLHQVQPLHDQLRI